jgi:uncharacterized membrane protein YraQ (UPF0718 family)
MIGFLFPVCECGNVPVARRLLMQGVPTPVAIGFLLAAPTINPIVIWATWTAFREQPEIVVLRVLLSLLIATIVGYIFSFQQDLTPILQPAIARYLQFNPPHQPKTKRQISRDQKSPSTPGLMREANPHSLLQPGTYLIGSKLGTPIKLDPNLRQTNNPNFPPRKSLHEKLSLVLDNIVQELRELGGVMVLGSAIAATIQVLSPRELILSLGSGPISSIVAMMLLAAAVSICSTVDSFFALSFASTFTSGSLLAFLVFGPMIDIKGVGLMLSIFRPRALFYLFGLAGMMTLLSTLFLNLQIM